MHGMIWLADDESEKGGGETHSAVPDQTAP